MESSFLDTIVELSETDKDNYNKVIIHKRKCVAYTSTQSVNIGGIDRDKVNNNEDDDQHRIYANIRSLSFKIPNDNDAKTPMISCYQPQVNMPKPRPKVPPKPKNLNRVPPAIARAASDPSAVKNIKSIKTPSQDDIRKDNENTHVGHFLTERLIEETKDIVAKNLMKEKEELLFRMQNNVNLLQDSLAEILSEIQDNSQHLESIVKKIRLDGGIVEADKLKLHIDELDSVTLLKTVLSVRLKTTQNKLELSKELKEMEFLNKKSMKLLSQISEAEILTKFRNTRGEVILKSLNSYLDQENLKRLRQYLDLRITLQTEMGDVKEKLHITMRQLEILKI